MKIKSDRFWKELTDYVLRQVETWIEDRGSDYFFTKLEPCPFCGANMAKLNGGETINWIACEDCEAESGAYETKEEAVKAWNDLTGRRIQEDE